MLKLYIMTLKEIYSTGMEQKNNGLRTNPIISFEIFPPKNDEDGDKLEKVLNHLSLLKKYNPAFVSLTYGAGGTTQNSSLNIIQRIQKELDLTVMPHFTCVGSSRTHVHDYLKDVQAMGIKNILALRGDIPDGVEQKNFDFKYANELVEFIKSETSLSIGVAGYPEGHIECKNLAFDLQNLKRKVEAGADAIFTQMFFDNDKLFDFIEKIQAMDIQIPVIPGILPIKSHSQLERMLSMVKVTVPAKLMSQLEKYKDNVEDTQKIGIEFASNQCLELIKANIVGLHFYTLNTSTSVDSILENLKVTAQ